jgi:phosphoglycerate dehydrogenase-like enzyme
MIIVAPCPFTEDFTLTPDIERALEPHTVHIIPDPAEAPDILSAAEILVTGFEGQAHDPLAYARAMPRLRWIHTLTAGLGSVASSELANRDVLITNGAGVFAVGIAEYAFASLVMLARGLPEVLLANASHRWQEHRLGWELAGKQVGIIGFGGIGRRLAELLAGAGIRVWALARRPEIHVPGSAERVLGPPDLSRLLAESDAIVLCASLNPTTHNLLGPEEFSRFKRGALFVNVSRGALVDERALAQALRSGSLGGAIIDVTASEPLAGDSPLWTVPNLWITPHIAGGTLEGRARSLDRFVVNLRHFGAGQLDRMTNVVDLLREISDSDSRPQTR